MLPSVEVEFRQEELVKWLDDDNRINTLPINHPDFKKEDNAILWAAEYFWMHDLLYGEFDQFEATKTLSLLGFPDNCVSRDPSHDNKTGTRLLMELLGEKGRINGHFKNLGTLVILSFMVFCIAGASCGFFSFYGLHCGF